MITTLPALEREDVLYRANKILLPRLGQELSLDLLVLFLTI